MRSWESYWWEGQVEVAEATGVSHRGIWRLGKCRRVQECVELVYRVSSASNLDKLERAKLSAARVITGLHNSCRGWVLSHVNVCGNKIADGLAREGSHKDSTHGGCLTFSEIVTRVKQDISSDPYMSGMKKTFLVLFCLGQAVGEMKLLLLGITMDILKLTLTS
ncbi:uncharacterized protein TNCV_4839951 [Trichonephila clavipes]|nr:uncharacterized protein TNCV_4839951 [Trichonephila clavipes]